ncbi:hypothetical protein K7G98_27550, partial [Saccharothrix sp. MB29]|nr:hypothetical protein [Saccharothrix sp. MB29]
LNTGLATGTPTGAAFGPFRTLVDADLAYRSSAAFERDRAYWRSAFPHRPEPATLATSTAAGGFVRREGPLDAEALGAGADRLGHKWSDVVIAAVAAYLARVTGAPEVVVGVPIAARLSRAERETPGLAANVLPVRVAVRPWTTVGDLCKQVESALIGALRHGRYRAEDIRRDLGLVGEGALYGPVVNAMAFDYAVEFAGSPVTAWNVADVPVEDLTVSVYDRSGGFHLLLDANAGRYRPDDVDLHSDGLRRWLTAGAPPRRTRRSARSTCWIPRPDAWSLA